MRRPIRIGFPAAASLLVNGLMVAALIHIGLGGNQSQRIAASLSVISLAALKGVEDGAEESEQAENPSAPSQTAPPAPMPPAAMPPLPRPPMPVPPMLFQASAETASTSTPAPPISAEPSRPASAAPAAAAAAASAAAPARRGTSDGLDANAPQGNSRAYAARVRSWLLAHKIYPKRAKMRHEEGIVRVHFVIDRQGRLIEGQVIGACGIAALDEEAAAMLRRASPYPAAPREIVGERIEITAPVEFILPV